VKGVQEPEPVPDLVDGSVALVWSSRFVAAQPRHRLAVQPASILIEELGAFLNDGRPIALSANSWIEVREEVDI
jgi:hypothetical protein